MIRKIVKKKLQSENFQVHDLYSTILSYFLDYNSLIDNKQNRRDDFRQIVRAPFHVRRYQQPKNYSKSPSQDCKIFLGENYSKELSPRNNIHRFLEVSHDITGIYKTSLEEVRKKIHQECKDKARDFKFLFTGYSRQTESERKLLIEHIKGNLSEIILRS